MSGSILNGMMILLSVCYVAGQLGAAAAETSAIDVVARLERLEAQYDRQMSEQVRIYKKQAEIIAELYERISDLELENHHQQNSYVSFTASATTEREYNVGDHVLFDSVLRNYGDSYYGENSTFICSHNAYYLFSVAVRAGDGGNMRAQIQLDDIPLVAGRGIDWDMGTNMVVTYCAEGQSVWVMCHSGQGNVMYDDGFRYSVFSGTLLRLA